MDERVELESRLETARRVLAVLEKQAAGYTSLTIPAHLRIQLEEKRHEVNSLEARLAQLKGREAGVPCNLPPRPSIFVGRKKEIARCLEALNPEERGWGVIIDGIGGIGKTALALEVAYRAKERAWFDAYLFVSAKTTWLTPDGVRQETLAFTSLDAFTREFARLLGETEIARMTDAEARRRALLDALRGRRALLIWDNLETLTQEERDHIAAFLRKLPSPNKAILTSRRRTGESALIIRLDRLSESEAFQLMEEVARQKPRVAAELQRAGEALRRALYDASGGSPLALHWTLGLVAQKGYTLEEALERLRHADRAGDLYRFLFADAVADLDENARAVLAALAAFGAPTTATALADVLERTRTEVQSALERLTALSLVNDLEGGRFALHPLTRTFVLGALRGAGLAVRLPAEGHRKALRFWVAYAQRYGGGHKDAYKTFDKLEAEWPNLEATAAALWEATGLPGTLQDEEAARMLNDLANALSTFLWFRGYWDERIRLATWAYRANEAREAWRDAGWRAYDVAWIYFYRGKTEEAQTWADRMARAMEKAGTRRDRAVVTRLQGLLARQQGDLDEAERHYTEALREYRALGEEDDQATVLNDLGNIARRRKDYARAEEFYREALALAENRKNTEQQAYIPGNLGRLALDRDRPREARKWFERERELAQEVGRKDLIADALAGLARVLEEEGRYAEALPLAEEALRIREALHERNLGRTRDLVARLRRNV